MNNQVICIPMTTHSFTAYPLNMGYDHSISVINKFEASKNGFEVDLMENNNGATCAVSKLNTNEFIYIAHGYPTKINEQTKAPFVTYWPYILYHKSKQLIVCLRKNSLPTETVYSVNNHDDVVDILPNQWYVFNLDLQVDRPILNEIEVLEMVQESFDNHLFNTFGPRPLKQQN